MTVTAVDPANTHVNQRADNRVHERENRFPLTIKFAD